MSYIDELVARKAEERVRRHSTVLAALTARPKTHRELRDELRDETAFGDHYGKVAVTCDQLRKLGLVRFEWTDMKWHLIEKEEQSND